MERQELGTRNQELGTACATVHAEARRRGEEHTPFSAAPRLRVSVVAGAWCLVPAACFLLPASSSVPAAYSGPSGLRVVVSRRQPLNRRIVDVRPSPPR